ncbi:hypothetical protein ACH4YO_27645 [Streptomyces noursei]|uniref:hypothetical protein n=1 Tax=Streptomyces noursei TaxID=1971 RepID=UPI0033FB3673
MTKETPEMTDPGHPAHGVADRRQREKRWQRIPRGLPAVEQLTAGCYPGHG